MCCLYACSVRTVIFGGGFLGWVSCKEGRYVDGIIVGWPLNKGEGGSGEGV